MCFDNHINPHIPLSYLDIPLWLGYMSKGVHPLVDHIRLPQFKASNLIVKKLWSFLSVRLKNIQNYEKNLDHNVFTSSILHDWNYSLVAPNETQ